MTANRVDLVQPALFYGGDYNPEQWPPEIWAEDARLMQAAGVNLATLGVFSWAKLEPQPGDYDFAWFDDVVALLHDHGIGICLATATASPPPWMGHRDPDSLPVTADGVRLWPGARQAYCPHSPTYRQAAAELVRRMATRYGRHPAVRLWHINNEYACHVPACYCDESAAAFRVWLKQRYGTLEALNDAWGTAFWSQQYGQWAEVMPPRRAPSFANPTQQLDWQRFSSDSLLALMQMEKAILRELSPNLPVTTNFMGTFKPLDYWAWARHEDVVSVDLYPDPADDEANMRMALNSDMMRSLGDGRPWMLMEQTPSAVNWRPRNRPKAPRQMRLWSYQAVARGANAIMFFQWRASRAGAEKFHGALVPHAGTKTRVWDEVCQLGRELQQLPELAAGRGTARVALLHDWPSWWALELDSHPSTTLHLPELIEAHYRPFYASNVPVDFARPGGDLSGYDLVIVPNLYLVDDAAAANIVDFVRQGGTAVLSFFSGIVDENDHIRPGGYPAPFRAMLGLWVEEFAPLLPGETVGVAHEQGPPGAGTHWSEVIHIEGAEVVARFADGFAAGGAAITRHTFGRGTAYYLGTLPAPAALADLYRRIRHDRQLHPPLPAPAGVEAVLRRTPGSDYLFVLNHNDAAAAVPLGDLRGVELLTGQELRGAVELEARGVGIVRLAARPGPAPDMAA